MTLLRHQAPLGALSTLVALAALHSAERARAEGITLNRYSPSETAHDGFALSRPIDTGHMTLDATLHLDYANDPLVLEANSGSIDSESSRVVSDQLAASLGFSFGLWHRLVVFAGVSGNLLMRGQKYLDPTTLDTVSTADGPGLGDGRIGARCRLLGEPSDSYGVAVQVAGSAPLGKWASRQQHFSGEASGTVMPALLGELRLFGVRATANLGMKVRRNVNVGRINAGDEVDYALGFGVPLPLPKLEATLEGYGSSTVQDFGQRETTPLEVLAGARYSLEESGLVFGLAGGPGLTRGIGSPDFRVVGMVGYEILREKKAPRSEAATPAQPKDSDGDGLLDDADECPKAAEDQDAFEDEDGCPDPDNDKDGIADTKDKCPLEAEDSDKFQDEDGCPDPDNDQDTIVDKDDKCPLEAEDGDKFQDEDGCADPDNDNDSVLDGDDECPNAPGDPAVKGCPKAVRIDLETGEIRILQQVQFANNKADILPQSYFILREVRDTLNANPQLGSVRVEGHTDSRGVPALNLDLSRRRAASVVNWLATAGVARERLHPFGCGATRPIADNKTADGRQQNRRVVFQVVDEEEAAAQPPETCQPALPE